MPHGFEMYRVFIAAPGDLEPDRQACHEAISEVNASAAMPAGVLLVEVGLRENDQITGARGIVSDNVRWSSYFIQLFQDGWGPQDLFRKLFLLAAECRDDPAMPMRKVVVCLKDAPHESNQEILQFRRELENRQDVGLFRYSSLDALREHLKEVCNGWTQDLIEAAKVGVSGDGAATH